jgi:transposase
MTDYREIMRLSSLGLNRTQIAENLDISRTTVIHVLQRTAAQGLDWQSAKGLSDRELTSKLFPNGSDTPGYHAPDYAYIHKEMAKPGMTQQLLWM